eukprot:GILJ01000653.1.p1 GENE.GILJ01000653.1~~GILJ01000653.1.p1  ORF type:complete len:293 (-),score=23.12 GILJ01000653.1:327-1205(-)
MAFDLQKQEQSNPAKFKTVFCRHYRAGYCERGDTCNFAHQDQELRASPRRNSAGEVRTMRSPHRAMMYTMLPPGQSHPNYKTVKCKFFEQGTCKFGAKCSFAHGDQDMRAKHAEQNHLPHGAYFNHELDRARMMAMRGPAVMNQEVMEKLRQATHMAQLGDTVGATKLLTSLQHDLSSSNPKVDMPWNSMGMYMGQFPYMHGAGHSEGSSPRAEASVPDLNHYSGMGMITMNSDGSMYMPGYQYQGPMSRGDAQSDTSKKGTASGENGSVGHPAGGQPSLAAGGADDYYSGY